MSKEKIIKDKILKGELVKWKDFKFIQPESLKEMTTERYEEYRASLLNRNLIDVFRVWQKGKILYCIDGYHRTLVFKKLEEEGYKIPEKQFGIFVDLKNEQEAVDCILAYDSKYADTQEEGLYEMIKKYKFNFDIAIPSIRIPTINPIIFKAGYLVDGVQDKDGSFLNKYTSGDVPEEKDFEKDGVKYFRIDFSFPDKERKTILEALDIAKKKIKGKDSNEALLFIARIFIRGQKDEKK